MTDLMAVVTLGVLMVLLVWPLAQKHPESKETLLSFLTREFLPRKKKP